MLKILLAAVIAYLIGSFSPSITLSRHLGGDVRTMGSGNAGTTNMLRSYGKKAALFTLCLDVLKGVVAVLIGRLIGGGLGYPAYIAALLVFCGHIWPVYYGFRGGKGIATALGAVLAVDPLLALILLAVAVIAMVITKRVSVGSILAAVCLPILCIWMQHGFWVPALFMAAIAIIKHKANIGRLLRGEEPTISFKK